MENINLFRVLILVAVILYVISPVDLCPGPIDDIILAVMTIACRKKLKKA